MANFPNWTLTVTSGMKASTIMRMIATNYSLLQSQLRSAMGAYSNFEGYMKSAFASNGALLPETLSHDIFSNIATNQHHLKFHATSHVNGVDNIPIVTSTKPGLISTTLYKRIYETVSGATPRPITVSSYTGSGGDKYIALGYRPKYVKIFQTGSVGSVIDAPQIQIRRGAELCVRHKVITVTNILMSAAHTIQDETYYVTNGTSGMTVHGSANVNLAHYNFLAIG
jgi:hypothetical protein